MKYYLAPLEGITGYIYRNAVNEFFGEGIDKYFAPFIMPYEKHILTDKERKQLCPEHNKGIKLIPQIMTSEAKEVIRLESALVEYGYDEYNLNLGCPSGTVVSKGRGAGFLADPEGIDRYLDYICSNTRCKVSVKTRLGMYESAEFEELLEVYNKYPLEELIIHPRVKAQLYKGIPDMNMYDYASGKSRNTLVYNGDVNSPDRAVEICNKYSESTDAIMIGRGMIRNPGLICQIVTGREATAEEILAFLNRLRDDYMVEMSGETHVLHKLKEVWSYMFCDYEEKYPKEIKTIKKAKRISEYQIAVNSILKNS